MLYDSIIGSSCTKIRSIGELTLSCLSGEYVGLEGLYVYVGYRMTHIEDGRCSGPSWDDSRIRDRYYSRLHRCRTRRQRDVLFLAVPS